MQSTTRKAAASVLFCSVAMALAAQAVAADAPGAVSYTHLTLPTMVRV